MAPAMASIKPNRAIEAEYFITCWLGGICFWEHFFK